MNTHPTTAELATLAAQLAVSRPAASNPELALAALNLWHTCANAITMREVEARYIHHDPEPPHIPLAALLKEIMPRASDMDRQARYRQYYTDKGTDGPAMLALHKAEGVGAGWADTFRAEFPAWNARQVSKANAGRGGRPPKNKNPGPSQKRLKRKIGFPFGPLWFPQGGLFRNSVFRKEASAAKRFPTEAKRFAKRRHCPAKTAKAGW